jgi:tetratricopeptide (TPR) repeat protein
MKAALKQLILGKSSGFSKKVFLVILFLTFGVLVAFWPLNQCGFVNIDDPVYVTENPHTLSGITLQGLRWAFSTFHAGFWHPLTWLSLMMDYQLYGLNPGGYHLTNLLLHIASTLLLFGLFRRLTGAIWPSAFIAAFFAFHPLHVESVAWIAERKDVLSAFFWMLTLYLYVLYTEKQVMTRYLFVCLSFVCGLMSKSMVVTLPAIMILLDYWPLGRLHLRDLKELAKIRDIVTWPLFLEKIPFIALSVVFTMLTLRAQLAVTHIPFFDRFGNAPVSFITYLGKTFWPTDLAVYYPFSYQLSVWQIVFACLLILTISTFVFVLAKRCPYLLVGWLWYAITLLPVIGIIQIGEFARADRYTYLPTIGIAIMLTWSTRHIFRNETIRKIILFSVGTVAIIIMAVLTRQQCGHWIDSIALFERALKVTENNYLAHNNLGIALIEKGRYEESIHHFNDVLKLQENDAVAYYNRGNAFYSLGRYQDAIDSYSEAIRLQSDYIAAYNNRGGAYTKLGRDEMAVNDYGRAIHFDPNFAGAYFNRGNLYRKMNQQKLAIQDYDIAIKLKPYHIEAIYNRGSVYMDTGEHKSGCNDYQKACSMGFCDALLSARKHKLCF